MVASIKEKLAFIYAGGKLKRFHARDTLNVQNIADHSFGVAWLVHLMYGDASMPAKVLLSALGHDLGEQIAGDVPGDTKAKVPELAALMNKLEDDALLTMDLQFNLSKEEARIVKLADIFEGMMFCIRERKMGSKMTDEVYETYKGFADRFKPVGRELVLFHEIQLLWTGANS